jgi:hypothetical protein
VAFAQISESNGVVRFEVGFYQQYGPLDQWHQLLLVDLCCHARLFRCRLY